MKKVLFTFDYELFLGKRSGTVADCLLQPTRKLLNLLHQYKVRGIFFVDTLYLWRLKQEVQNRESVQEDYQAIVQQLAEAVAAGHSVFAHLHPHWLDAVYLANKNEWDLSNTRYYRFAALPTDKQAELFRISMHIIEEITANQPGYQADAYRAGGWSIQPFSHFYPYFIQYGIKHEFSVIPGKYHLSNVHSFDFREASVNQVVYRFDTDICENNPGGKFTEWTISTLHFNRFEKWFDFKISGLLKRLQKNNIAKGQVMQGITAESGDLYCKPECKRIVSSFEGLNLYRVYKLLRSIKKVKYYQFISHPKLISDYDFRMAAILLKQLTNFKNLETDFRK